jgi:hypothetical protein
MALTEDQRALLSLLLQGDTYGRIAEVLGTESREVRRRAHEAAEELDRETNPDLSPAAVRTRLAALEGRPVEKTPVSTPPFTRNQRLPLLIAAGGLVLLAVVLALTLFGGGDDDSEAPPSSEEEAIVVRLAPVGGATASGTLTIARIADQPAVDLDIRGLTPTRPDQSYVLWFVGAGSRSLPVAFQAVDDDGRIEGRTPIASAAIGVLPSLDTAELTLTQRREAVEAIRKAGASGTLPERIGTTILRGPLRGDGAG